MLLHRLFRIATVVVLVGACRPLHDGGSDIKHDLGRVANDSSAFQWLALDEAVARGTIVGDDLAAAGLTPDQLPDATDPLRQRVQFWIDQIDAVVRSRDTASLAGAGKPHGVLIPSSEPNAHSGYSDVCLAFSATFAGPPSGETQGDGTNAVVVFDRAAGTFRGPVVDRDPPCAPASLPVAEQAELLKWTFAPHPACTFTIEGTEVRFAEACRALIVPDDPWYTGMKKATRLAVVQSVNWTVFFTGLLRETKEEEFVAILAHEMGHYYMSHANTPRALYNQFYRLDASNPEGKPKDDPAARVLGDALLAALDATRGLTRYPPHANQNLHSALFDLTKSLRKEMEKLAPAPCQPLSAAVAANDYPKYEDLIAACTGAIKTGSGVGQFPVPKLKSTLSAFSPRILAKLGLGEDLAGIDTIKALYDTMNAKLPVILDQPLNTLDDLTAKAAAFPLGLYTFEQEADELSLEWLMDLGVKPDVALDAQFKLMKDDPGAAACATLRKNKWKDAQGNPVFVTVGDLHDDHHNGCYRAFNLAREITVHKLKPKAGVTFPVAPGGTWKSFQKKLADWEATFQ